MITKPTVEVGDMIKVGGRWHRVESTAGYAGKVWASQRGRLVPNWLPMDQITDVYTKAEQEANGALVTVPWQEIDDLIYDLLPDEITWSNGVDHFSEGEDEHYVLTPEATAALGEFQPVPERDVVPGDCVRLSASYGGTFVQLVESVSERRQGEQWLYGTLPDGRSWSRRPDEVELVAPEDPAYWSAFRAWLGRAESEVYRLGRELTARGRRDLVEIPDPDDDGVLDDLANDYRGVDDTVQGREGTTW